MREETDVMGAVVRYLSQWNDVFSEKMRTMNGPQFQLISK